MIDRLLILLFFVVILLSLLTLWRLIQRRQIRRLAAGDLPMTLLNRLDGQRQGLLYFTADHCAQCRFQQAPILENLAAIGNVQVLTIDAVAESELARHFGVMTVPTTVILDHSRRAKAVNHGLATLPRLKEQVGHTAV